MCMDTLREGAQRIGEGGSLDLDQIGEILKTSADEVALSVVQRWRELGKAEEWLTLPEDLDMDHLPSLIRSLADSALVSDFGKPECTRLVDAAALHGQHREEAGFGEDLIFREYHLLRRSLWNRLRERFGENAQTFYATMRLDTVIGLATAASLQGYHWKKLNEQGRWPQALDELLEEWPGLPEAP